MNELFWTIEEATELCRRVEAVCPQFGCHVALTGGTLYKHGQRKDCDILFYRIRQIEVIDGDGLWEALKYVGLTKIKGFGWCHKALFQPDQTKPAKKVDCFFPEAYDRGIGPDGQVHASAT